MNEAHGMRLNHAIFKGPLDPGIELEEKKTPDAYSKHYGGDRLGPRLKVWKVHEGVFPEVDVGLVSTPYGFADSPDAEVISSGINSKGPRSVALGRQGNFFIWGFFGDPSMLTPSARKVFINTVHYMKGFDGQRPLVKKRASARERALSMPTYMRNYDYYAKYAEKQFSGSIREETGMDPEKLEAFLVENEEYLYWSNKVFELDEDARELGLSNRKLETLDAIVKRLRDDPGDERGRRLVERYIGLETLGGSFSIDGLERWLESSREFLFFSDVGGYRWFVDENARKVKRRKAPPAASAGS